MHTPRQQFAFYISCFHVLQRANCIIMSAAECVYGDEESSEIVTCVFDDQSSTLTCPQPEPRSRRTAEPRVIKMKFLRGGRDEMEDEEALVPQNVGCVQDTIVGGPGKRRGLSIKDRVIRRLCMTTVDVVGEFIGTFLLTLVICTAVASSVVSGALTGLWQVAVVCGLGVTLSIYCTAYISDAHLNPAVTLSFAIVRRQTFSYAKIVPYILGQLLGAFCAGGVLYGMYRHAISEFEDKHHLERGKNGSELSAMVFGEYFPNPAVHGYSHHIVSPVEAMLIEAWGTGILVFVIFSLTGKQNSTVSGGHKVMVPLLIGTTVAILISLYAPLTQTGLNPARDFGPRAFSAIVGWGKIAIPGPRNGFWVYIVGPIIGGPVGGMAHDWLVSAVVEFTALMRRRRALHHDQPPPFPIQNS